MGIRSFLNGLFDNRSDMERQQEKRINAEMAFRAQERAFRRYDQDLEKSIRRFKQMAIDAKEKNQMANAVCAARFVRRMEAIQVKVTAVSQHFEMLHCLSDIGDVMVQFMDSCRSMGCDLKEQININALNAGQMDMETGLNKLAFVTECVDQALASIDSGIPDVTDGNGGITEEDMAELELICSEMSCNKAAKPQTEQPPVVVEFPVKEPAAPSEAAVPTAAPAPSPMDEEFERLERRLAAQ